MAMQQAGLGDQIIVAEGDFSAEAGHGAMGELLVCPDRPTAVLAVNDEAAVGAMEAIQGAGLRVPEDISVMGFDNLQIGRLYSPRLTTVHVQAFELGYQGMMALSRLLAKEAVTEDHVLETQIIERATTSALGG